MNKYKLFTDGGARGNPGPSAIGALIFDEHDKLLWFDAKFIGSATNNIAEYKALILGLEHFVKNINNNKAQITCYLDSELIVKQINREYKVKNETLKNFYSKVLDLSKNLDITFSHVERKYNKFADKLVNICLDAQNE